MCCCRRRVRSTRTRQRWTAPAHPTVATEPFARLDAIGPDTWAVISTPLGGDRTTYANGGIIAGRTGVIAVEGFYRSAGAQWLAEHARRLTGRWPTHVVLTHYHLDHASGLTGYQQRVSRTRLADERTVSPKVLTTEKTRKSVLAGGPVAPPRDEELLRAYADVVIVGDTASERIDLGNRQIELVPLAGHTSSDVAIVDADAGITFAGDLLWNGMFPNYVDATPTTLMASVQTIIGSGASSVVPGHGAMCDRVAVDRYVNLLRDLERAARAGRVAGTPAKEVAAAYRVPPALGEWMASPTGVERAISAWYKELTAPPA